MSNDLDHEGAKLGYVYGATLRAFESMANAFRRGFELGHRGVTTPETAEAASIRAYNARVARERTLGRLHVERLYRELRQRHPAELRNYSPGKR